MLFRSLRASPPILLFLIFCTLFGWQLSKGAEPQIEPPPPPPPAPEAEPPKEAPVPPPPPPPPPAPPKEEVKEHAKSNKPRLAIVTFVTEQRSYLHLSLKNKDRKLSQPAFTLS
jgi:hypothetical protein